jgi:predicted ATP-binding protein involved in virulence
VLIDEVDAHLHVAWQQNLGFWLTSRFPAIQFLVTTHSPFICQAASKRGIIRLPAPGEDRHMEHVDERLYAAIVNGGADAAVMSELFGLEHAHSERAEELREVVAALEARVIDGTASPEEIVRYKEGKQQLPESMDELADRSIRALLARGAQP